LLASGRVVLSSELDLWYSASFALWGRIGGVGPIFNGTRDTSSFVADRDGMLELAVYNGEWATPAGDLATPPEAYAGGSGGIDVLVLRWSGSARDGVEALAPESGADPLIATELDRLRAALPPPAGWRHLWFLGPTEIYSDVVTDGHAAIHVDTRSDVGILQKPVELPLGPETTISWRWRVDELPARAAENDAFAHDYMSLAVEFENGKDITWYWSAVLPEGTHFACPLPTWNARETHWVLRSGSEGLGRWVEEKRTISADYRVAIGEPPSRIVAVWLIAVSLFGHRRGRADFADVRIHDGSREIQVI